MACPATRRLETCHGENQADGTQVHQRADDDAAAEKNSSITVDLSTDRILAIGGAPAQGPPPYL